MAWWKSSKDGLRSANANLGNGQGKMQINTLELNKLVIPKTLKMLIPSRVQRVMNAFVYAGQVRAGLSIQLGWFVLIQHPHLKTPTLAWCERVPN